MAPNDCARSIFSLLAAPVFVGLSWDFVDLLKTKLVALSGGFRGLFVDVGAPPAIENTRKPTALESTENIHSQVPPP